MTTFGLFVKHPLPGGVKTRLAAQLGAVQAAEAYAAFIEVLVERFRGTAERRILCYSPATEEAEAHFTQIGGADYSLWPQPEADLGSRMARFFADHLRGAGDCAVLIGSDSPTLPRDFVDRAFALLEHADCVIGPATDGGYYLIGQRETGRPIFDGIDWSTSRVLAQTVKRIANLGARLEVLPPWYDVDTPNDWQFLLGHLDALRAAGVPMSERALARVLRVNSAALVDPL